MINQPDPTESNNFSKNAVEASIKIAFLFLLLSWCFNIIKPFITPLVWGMIIAIALYPLYQKLSALLGGRGKLTSTLITITFVLIIIGPCVLLADIISQNAQSLAEKLTTGNFSIPAPTENVANWPIVGKPIFAFWQLAATNITEALSTLAPQLKQVTQWLVSSSVSTIMTILQLLVSVIICGMLLNNGKAGYNLAVSIGERLAGVKGEEFTILAIATIRGVARGVLGVALIQSILAGIGFFIADIPGAGILTILCLFIAIVQLPTFILLLPLIIYVFSIHSSVFATIFMIWMIAVGLLDNILKPILMGRGIDLPIAIIFIGAIGGMMFSGIIGLFIGAVILALGYKLFLFWLHEQG